MVRAPAVSIVIPTLNEEYRLPRLLRSLKKQSFTNYELIVADANSTDKTRALAKNAGARVVQGGLPGKGRNAGARVAKAPVLFFLDADVVLPKDWLEKTYIEFTERNLSVAAVPLRADSPGADRRFAEAFWNTWVRVLGSFRPQTAGWGTVIKRDTFRAIKGYREELLLSEDLDLGWRATKKGRYGVLHEPLLVSDRRFQGSEKWSTLFLYIRFGITYFFLGGKAFKPMHYTFGNHPEHRAHRRS
jgi:glycosyltransferase involved in cell wall biosynthesis